jgi:hypothetical protein
MLLQLMPKREERAKREKELASLKQLQAPSDIPAN